MTGNEIASEASNCSRRYSTCDGSLGTSARLAWSLRFEPLSDSATIRLKTGSVQRRWPRMARMISGTSTVSALTSCSTSPDA